MKITIMQFLARRRGAAGTRLNQRYTVYTRSRIFSKSNVASQRGIGSRDRKSGMPYVRIIRHSERNECDIAQTSNTPLW